MTELSPTARRDDLRAADSAVRWREHSPCIKHKLASAILLESILPDTASIAASHSAPASRSASPSRTRAYAATCAPSPAARPARRCILVLSWVCLIASVSGVHLGRAGR